MKPPKSGNSIVFGDFSRVTRRDRDAFDALPVEIKKIYWAAIVDWHTRTDIETIERAVNSGTSLSTVVSAIQDAVPARDLSDVFEFARWWPSRLGRYPAIAARSSIQTYENHLGGHARLLETETT